MQLLTESAGTVEGGGQQHRSGGSSAGTVVFRFAWVPPAVLAVLTVLMAWLQPDGVFGPDWLLLTLNTVVLTLLPLGVAVLAAVAYRSSGLLSVLAIGAAMLALAGGGTLPAVLLASLGPDASVAMHNSAFLLSACCQFVASLTAVGVLPLQLPGSRTAHVATAYTAVIVCVAGVLALIVTGRMPTFFVQGQGPTELRQVVLGLALALFGLAAIFWWQTYVRVRLPFLRWYYLTLILFCLSIVPLLLGASVGGVLSWVGRSAQFVAVPYVLIAVLGVRAAAGSGGFEHRFASAVLQATLPYRPLLDSATEAIVALDDRGAVLYWNDTATRMFGIQAADASGADFAALVAPELYQQELRAALAAYAARSDASAGGPLTTTAADRDGTQFPVEAAFYDNELGGRKLTICVMRDITEQVLARQKLAQSEQLFRVAMDGAPQGMAVVGLDLNFLQVNVALCAMLGRDQQWLLAHTVADAIHPDDLGTYLIGRDELLTGTSERAVHERRWRKSDGSDLWVMHSTALLRDSADQPLFFVSHIQDNSDVHRTREDLEELNQRLAQSNKDLRDFAFVASHDLQEPVRAVVSFTGLLAKRNPDLDEKSRDYIRRAQRASLRMQTLIEDLLTYSRVDSRARTFAEVRTAEVVAEVIDEFSATIEQTSATVTVARLPNVTGDESQIHQLFQNLLGNALKYSSAEPPLIDISATPDPGVAGFWQFCVKDNGIGFDPMFAERIFVIFQRLHARDEYSGTGIGLAVCKRVVEGHGGRIWAESQPSAGTTIRFTLKGA